MATGTPQQLGEMVVNLRAEAGYTMLAAAGINTVDMMKVYLARTQRELYQAYDWPALKVWREVGMASGQALYNYPADLPFQQVVEVYTVTGAEQWTPLDYGISPNQRSYYPPDSLGWPVTAWEHNADSEQIEVWPTPSQDGLMKLRGMKALAIFLADSDRSTLDGDLIVLHAAAELLARQKAEDAQLKQNKAQRMLTRLLGRQGSSKRKPFIVGGESDPNPSYASRPRPGIDYIA